MKKKGGTAMLYLFYLLYMSLGVMAVYEFYPFIKKEFLNKKNKIYTVIGASSALILLFLSIFEGAVKFH